MYFSQKAAQNSFVLQNSLVVNHKGKKKQHACAHAAYMTSGKLLKGTNAMKFVIAKTQSS